MTVHHASIVLAAALVCIGAACGLSERPGAQQTLDDQRGPEAAPLVDLPLDELRARAEQGDAGAQIALGWKYFDREGVPQDDAEAVR